MISNKRPNASTRATSRPPAVRQHNAVWLCTYHSSEIVEASARGRRVHAHEKWQASAILSNELGAHAACPRLFRLGYWVLKVDNQRIGAVIESLQSMRAS